MRNSHVLIAVTLMSALFSAGAAEQSLLAEELARCRREQDDAVRLACFDRVAEKAGATSSDSFGASGSAVASKRKAEAESRTPEQKRMTAVVKEVKRQPRGEFVVTLDNGQVWAQKTAERFPEVKLGEEVTILAGALGSYRLLARGRATLVTRLE